MLTHMAKPTPEQCKGYDIVIWAGDDQRILANSFTIIGEVILHGLLPEHRMGEASEITQEPDEFFKGIPRGTKVGVQDIWTGTVLPFIEDLVEGVRFGELQ